MRADSKRGALALERLIQEQWCEVLDLDRVAPDQDFFAAGGQSLAALRVLARLRDATGISLDLADLLAHPTPRALGEEAARRAPRAGAAPPPPPAPRRPRPGQVVPSSPGQRRLWVLSQLEQASAAFNVPVALELRGPVRLAALLDAYDEVIARHPALGCTIRVEAGEPVQRYEPGAAGPALVVDLSDLPPADAQALSQRLAHAAAGRPFVLDAGGALHELVVLRAGPGRTRAQLVFHHAVSDRWSVEVFLIEWGAAYSARVDPAAAPLRGAPHAFADLMASAGEDHGDALDAWAARLRGLPDLVLPPGAAPLAAAGTRRAAHRRFSIDGALLQRLREVPGYTPFMWIAAAWAAALARVSGCTDFGVGTAVANRRATAHEGVVGFFTNTLVLRCDLRGDPTGAELLARLREVVLEALTLQHVPFADVVAAVAPTRRRGDAPLFNVLLTFDERPARQPSFHGLEADVEAQLPGEMAAEIALSVGPGGGVLSYDVSRVEPRTAEQLERAFLGALEGLLTEPTTPVTALPLLAAREEEWLLGCAIADPAPPATGPGLVERLYRMAERRPDAVSLVCADLHLSRRALCARVAAWAEALQREGVRPECFVLLALPPGPDMLVAMLAVLSCGAAYVPLDPAQPRARQALIVDDLDPALCLTTPELSRCEGVCVRTLGTDALGAGPAGTAGPRLAAPHPQSAAYAMYTSGSSGRPKGVVVAWRQLEHFLAAMDAVLDPRCGQRWLSVTSASFDISVLELLWTVSRGVTVVLPAPESPPAAPPLELSLFYFASRGADAYRLLLEGARAADEVGLAAVWTPERHFHEFGGPYPAPAVTAAAVAAVTRSVRVRAGSVVLPLHDPIEVAEQWSVVDNLSGGRVDIAFASGWHPTDFVLAPGDYDRRKEILFERIEEVRRAWRGEPLVRTAPDGRAVEVRVLPRPVQAELPVWVTAARDPETFRRAGAAGAHVLTHLLGQDLEEVRAKIAAYRDARQRAGLDPATGRVTLMLHTLVGSSSEAVREAVRAPLRAYLSSSIDLLAGVGRSADVALDTLPQADVEELVDWAVDRFIEHSGLFGSVDEATRSLERVVAAGVDEVACLVDFGVDEDLALAGVRALGAVQRAFRSAHPRAPAPPSPPGLARELARHRITHLQTTPSLLSACVEELEDCGALAWLDELLVGGEAFAAPLAGRLRAQVTGNVRCMYGPTEATVWASCARVGDAAALGATVELGEPLADTGMLVLGTHGDLCPVGTPGELCIAGPGVARGYLGRPAATAERFVPDPFASQPGARLYCTGDRVRRHADARLEFLGREDGQVKIRGVRVELGEVCAALEAVPGVRESACIEHAGELVAFVCTGDAARRADLGEDALRILRQRLPVPMVPARLKQLPAMPLNANGKVDRHALRALAGLDDEAPMAQELHGPTEAVVAEVMADLLGRETVAPEASFFALGGHSLSALTATFRLRERTGVSIPLRAVFEVQTARGLAALIDALLQVNTDRERHDGARRTEMVL